MTQQTPQQLDQNWSNYWQGRTAAQSGSALVGIEDHPQIQSFWVESFAKLPKNACALDLACGAGTVAKVLNGLGFTDISGLDISSAAIDVLKKSLPDVSTFVSSADATPFEDAKFDVIVSQYGFEYGDFEAVIPEIARILKPGGRFLALSHKADGAIYREVSQQLEQITAIEQTGFIDAARGIFEVAMTKDSFKTPEEVDQVFRPAQAKLLELAKTHKRLAEHIYFSTQRMFKQRSQYHYKDIVNWLDGTDHEVKSFIGRMTSMKTAAIYSQKMDGFMSAFSKSGLEMCEPRVLIDDIQEELGWVFDGVKA